MNDDHAQHCRPCLIVIRVKVVLTSTPQGDPCEMATFPLNILDGTVHQGHLCAHHGLFALRILFHQTFHKKVMSRVLILNGGNNFGCKPHPSPIYKNKPIYILISNRSINCNQRLSNIYSHVYLRVLSPSRLYQALTNKSPFIILFSSLPM